MLADGVVKTTRILEPIVAQEMYNGGIHYVTRVRGEEKEGWHEKKVDGRIYLSRLCYNSATGVVHGGCGLDQKLRLGAQAILVLRDDGTPVSIATINEWVQDELASVIAVGSEEGYTSTMGGSGSRLLYIGGGGGGGGRAGPERLRPLFQEQPYLLSPLAWYHYP